MHIETRGQGPDLVMLHGWSMHSAVWQPLAGRLEKYFTLHLVDLPGHGRSMYHDGDLELESVLGQLIARLPPQANWLGWSLGGLVALAMAARYPAYVNKLVMLAATPCFVQKPGWACAMEATVFRQFADNLAQDQSETLKKFLLLQAKGCRNSREMVKQLSQQLMMEPPPAFAALHAGLRLLIETDLRDALASLSCPTRLILGDRDTLIPAQMLQAAKHINPHLQTVVLPGAGHAPFIACADACRWEIGLFLHE